MSQGPMTRSPGGDWNPGRGDNPTPRSQCFCEKELPGDENLTKMMGGL